MDPFANAIYCSGVPNLVTVAGVPSNGVYRTVKVDFINSSTGLPSVEYPLVLYPTKNITTSGYGDAIIDLSALCRRVAGFDLSVLNDIVTGTTPLDLIYIPLPRSFYAVDVGYRYIDDSGEVQWKSEFNGAYPYYYNNNLDYIKYIVKPDYSVTELNRYLQRTAWTDSLFYRTFILWVDVASYNIHIRVACYGKQTLPAGLSYIPTYVPRKCGERYELHYINLIGGIDTITCNADSFVTYNRTTGVEVDRSLYSWNVGQDPTTSYDTYADPRRYFYKTSTTVTHYKTWTLSFYLDYVDMTQIEGGLENFLSSPSFMLYDVDEQQFYAVNLITDSLQQLTRGAYQVQVQQAFQPQNTNI